MIHRQKNFTALLVGLKWERVCSPGDTWRCLRTSVIVPTECVCVGGYYEHLVEAWDAVTHLTMHRTSLTMKNHWAQNVNSAEGEKP